MRAITFTSMSMYSSGANNGHFAAHASALLDRISRTARPGRHRKRLRTVTLSAYRLKRRSPSRQRPDDGGRYGALDP